MMRRAQGSSSRSSYPANKKWKSVKESFISLSLECYEEPLTYSQFQAAKTAKAEYAKNQQIIKAAKEGRLVFLPDGKTKILDKPFSQIPEIIALGNYKPPPPRPPPPPTPPTHVVNLPSPPIPMSPAAATAGSTILPTPVLGILSSASHPPLPPPKDGRRGRSNSPDIIFVGETPPKNISPIVSALSSPPAMSIVLPPPQPLQPSTKRKTAHKPKDTSPIMISAVPTLSPHIVTTLPTNTPSDKLVFLPTTTTINLDNLELEFEKRQFLSQLQSQFRSNTGAQTAVVQPKGSVPGSKDAAEKKKGSSKADNSSAATNWVPLDAYYYGKTEGNPAYSEPKGEFRFKCFYCMKMLYNNVAAMLHIQGHIDTEKQVNLDISDLTQCKHCFKQFDTPFEMQTHIERVHMNNANVLLCRICEKDHSSRNLLTEHMRRAHNACEMPYICQLCNFRSSMYSDVVDHFKKKHSSSQFLLCLYCLRVFTTRVSNQGFVNTNVFYNHVLKHQIKKSTKKCQHCKLIFTNSADLKEHRKKDHMPNQKGAIAANSSKNTAQPDQVMIKVTTETKKDNTKHGGTGVSSSSGGVKSLNVPTIKKVVEQKIVFSLSTIQKSECMECGNSYGKNDHFSKYIQCSLCRFATSCSFGYANHMMSFHSGQQSASTPSMRCAVERQLEALMYCMCGFSSHYGNRIATHLVSCSKTWCSSEPPDPSPNVPLDEFGRKMKDPRKKPGASLLDVLGLVKKDSIQTTGKIIRTESPPPPPVEMPEVSVSDPPPRRPSLLKGSLKRPSFKTVLSSSSPNTPPSGDTKESILLPFRSTSSISSSSTSAFLTSVTNTASQIVADVNVKQEKTDLAAPVGKREAEEPAADDSSSNGKAKRLKLSAKVVLLDDGCPIEDATKIDELEQAAAPAATATATAAIAKLKESVEEKEKKPVKDGESDKALVDDVNVGGKAENSMEGSVTVDEVAENKNQKEKVEEEKEREEDSLLLGKEEDVVMGDAEKVVNEKEGDEKELKDENEAGIMNISEEEEESHCVEGGGEKEVENKTVVEEEEDNDNDDNTEAVGELRDLEKENEDDVEMERQMEKEEENVNEEEKETEERKIDRNEKGSEEVRDENTEETLIGENKKFEDEDSFEQSEDIERTMKDKSKRDEEEKLNENMDNLTDEEELEESQQMTNEREKKGEEMMGENDDELLDDDDDNDKEEEEPVVKDGKGSEEGMKKEVEKLVNDNETEEKDNEDEDRDENLLDDDDDDDDNDDKEQREEMVDGSKQDGLIDDNNDEVEESGGVAIDDDNSGEKNDEDGDNKGKESVEDDEEEKMMVSKEDDLLLKEGDDDNDESGDLLKAEEVKSTVDKSEPENASSNQGYVESDNDKNEDKNKMEEENDKSEITRGGIDEDQKESEGENNAPTSTDLKSSTAGVLAMLRESQGEREGRPEEGKEKEEQKDMRTTSAVEAADHSNIVCASSSSSSTSGGDTSLLSKQSDAAISSSSFSSEFPSSSADRGGSKESSSGGGDYNRSTDRSRSRDRDRERDRGGDRDRDRYRDRYNRDRDRDYHHHYDRNDRDRYRDDDRRRDRDRDRDRHRDYDRNRDRDRDRERDRHRYRERDRDYKHRDDRHYYR